MPSSRSRLFSRLARGVNTQGTITTSGIASDVELGGGVEVYASRASLPTSGNTAGDQAYVTGNNRLYIWNGSGWYNVALLNVAPSIQSVLDSDSGTTPFSLAIDGTPTTITITALDSDGDPVTYAATSDSDFAGLASLSQADNVFTITPFSQDSATTQSGTITFTATDGINVASSGVQTFTLNFVSEYWDETVLSIGSSSTNGLNNSTFIDRSTNAHTVTPTGTPTQTAFHPYLDNWSVEFDGSGDYLKTASHSSLNLYNTDFTLEGWFYATAPGGNEHIWASYIDVNNRESLYFSNSTTLNWWVNGSARISTTVNAFQWYHFAVVDNSGTTTLYIDGVSQGTWTNTYTNGSRLAWIGTYDDLVTPTDAFTGYISNLRFVRGTALYTSNFTPPTEKLTAVSGTELLTCQSNRFIDNSTNGYTITSTGDVKVSGFNPFGQGSEYAVGENKGSVDLDGDYLSLSSSDVGNLGTADYTVQFWIYKRGTTNDCIIDLRGGDLSHGVSVEMDTKVTVFYGGTPFQDTGSFNNYAWNHIAICRSSGTLKGFINGEQIFSVADTNNRNNTNNTSKVGVNYSNAQPTDALISDIKVTHTAEYTSAFTPPTSPLGNTNAKLYLPMDNLGIFDKTSNNTLTLAGNTSTSTTKTKYAVTSMRVANAANDYLITSGLEIGHSEDLTIEGWFNFDFTNSNVYMASHDTTYAANNNMYQLGLSSGRVAWWIGGSLPSNQRDSSTLSTNTWYHLAWVKNGTSYKIYKDGSQVASFTNSAIIQSHEWRVGNTYDGGSQGMTGYIEGFQILLGVAKYTTNFTPPTQEQGRGYQAGS